MNIEEIDILGFTYGQHFRMSRGHSGCRWASGAIGENVATRGCELELWLVIEPSGISALVNVNNVKISDLLAFVVMLSVPLFAPSQKSLVVEAYTSFKIIKTFLEESGDSFTRTLKNQWHFYFTRRFAKRYLNNYFPMKVLLQESVKKKQYQSKWSKDRSSRPEVFCKKGALRNFAKFTGK